MKEMPVNATGEFIGVTDHRLWKVLDNYVDGCMQRQDLIYVDAFFVGETACKRGHKYVSIFADRNHKIIFVTHGDDSSTMTAFREHLVAHGGRVENIKLICCDMGKGFKSGIEKEFPNAIVIYDRFHVMEHMTLAVDKARRHEWNVLRESGRLKEATYLKGQRFLLLKNIGNLQDWQEARVDAIKKSHKDIGTVYSLKESLRDTGDFESKYDASDHLVAWLLATKHTGLGSLKDIITLIDKNFDEILHWFDSGMSNGVMESINSVIQAVKARA